MVFLPMGNKLNKLIKILKRAPVDIDLATPRKMISREHAGCPWNEAGKTDGR
jgi:hypothetical protein